MINKTIKRTRLNMKNCLCVKRIYFATSAASNNIELKPVAVYDNADIDKLKMFLENRRKAGVYRWINKVNGKSYVGSSVSLTRRLQKYYDLNYLAKTKRLTEKALLKYGFSNFRVEILEYCDVNNAIEREQYYMDLLLPEYNIAKFAGSNLGFRHRPGTFLKWKTLVLSEEDRKKKALSTINATAAIKIAVSIENINTNDILYYSSLANAGKALGVSRATVSQALLGNRLIKNTFLVRKINK